MQFQIIIFTICVCVLIVILLGIFLQRKDKQKIAKQFVALIFSAILYLIINLVCDLCEGHPEHNTLSFVFNLLAFIAIDVILCTFVVYLSSLLNSSGKRKYKWLSILVYSTTGIHAIATIIMGSLGQLFKIDSNGNYVEQPLSFILYIISALIMLELIIVIILERKCCTKRQFAVILIYLCCPIPAMVLELACPDLYSMMGVAATLSILLVYILAQDTFIEQGKAREAELEDISNRDFLTNLNNRRAFFNFIQSLKYDTSIGIIYCDINGLKYTNDHFGHRNGDELIIRFSNLIIKVIDKNNIFRIAGDEFVVLLPGIQKEGFQSLYDSLSLLIRSNRNIASIGKAFGKTENIEQLISIAEKDMFNAKNILKESPEYGHLVR